MWSHAEIFHVFVCVCPTASLYFYRKRSPPGKRLNQVRKCAMMVGERRRNRWSSGEEGEREGGRRVTAIGVVGGVVDCFSYKSGIADRSPCQTTGYSGLCVSVTGAKEGGRASYNSYITSSCHPSLSLSSSPVSLWVELFHSVCISRQFFFFFCHSLSNLSESLQKYGPHQFAARWRTSAQLGLNCPNWQPEELSSVVFQRWVLHFPQNVSSPPVTCCI